MVTEKLEKSYDLWEKTETFGVEQRVRLYCMFISEGNLRADKCVFSIMRILQKLFIGGYG